MRPRAALRRHPAAARMSLRSGASAAISPSCGPHLVHTHLGYADLLGGPAARSLGIPTVTTIHSHAPPATPRDCVRDEA